MQAFWFGVIAVLWAGFILLEGFDFGVGMLMPFIARSETDRQVITRAIGPVWDGNEVWLLVAGGATFAAFPEWYASLFSGLYLAFALLLVGLILRGIGIEYRGKAHTARGRTWCDIAFVAGSYVPALLIGVAFANLLRGVKMTPSHDVTSSFISLLSPYALLGGVVTVLLFALHGALYLQLRTDAVLRARAKSYVPALSVATGVALLGFVIWTGRTRANPLTDVLAVVIVLSVAAAALRSRADRDGQAFTASAVASVLLPIWLFACLWPDVLPARNNPAFSLTVHNASSSHYTLLVMTVVALVLTPIVLAYQAWTYWVFRARVTGTEVGDGYGGSATRVAGAMRASAATMLGTSTPKVGDGGRHRPGAPADGAPAAAPTAPAPAAPAPADAAPAGAPTDGSESATLRSRAEPTP